MEQMYSSPSQGQEQDSQPSDSSSDTSNKASQALSQSTPSKILSTGGLIMAILLSLLLGLAYVVRSLKNVKLKLKLLLKRDDRAEKKY